MWLERNAPHVGFYVMAFLPKMSTINQYGWRFWNKRSRNLVVIVLGSPLFVGLAKCFRSRLARGKKCVSHMELLFNFCATHVYGTILPKYYTAVTIWCIFKYALGSVNDKCTISLWHCSQQDSPRGGKWSGVEMTEEEALVEQQRMFAEARARMNGANIPKQSDSDRSMDRWQIFHLCPFLNESLGSLDCFSLVLPIYLVKFWAFIVNWRFDFVQVKWL